MNASELISRFPDAKKSGAGWVCKCPAHEDTRASLSIGQGDSGIVLHCHAGCQTEDICRAKGLTLADLFPDKPYRNGHSKRIVATYDYQDENGELLFQVCRFEPKDFRQRRPDPSCREGWDWKTAGIRRVLFRLPEILSATARGLPIYICEGEKDVLAMVEAGFEATCNAGGAGNGKWLSEFSDQLLFADVFIVADKDEPGRQHARRIAESLSAKAATVKVIELPDVNGKPVKDAADFFAAGGQSADLDELAQASPVWTRNTPADGKDLRIDYGLSQTAPEDEPEPIGRIYKPSQLAAFKVGNDPDSLIGERWLCKRGKLLVVAPSGAGKSSLEMQMAVSWAVNLPIFGITPARALSSVIIGDENDEGDLAEMLQGVCHHLNIQADSPEFNQLEANLDMFHCPAVGGEKFLRTVENWLLEHPKDIAWLDPLVSYADVDITRQDGAAQFLRRGLSRISEKTGVIWAVIHHTPKTSRDPRAKTGWKLADYQFAGAGSYDLAGWARAAITLEQSDERVYRLIFPKRGDRAGATHPNGEPTRVVWLRRAEQGEGIFWQQIDPPEESTAAEGEKKPSGGRPSKLDALIKLGLGPVIDKATSPVSKNELAKQIEIYAANNAMDVKRSLCKQAVEKLVENKALKKTEEGYVKP
jgi:5S rRNA maturation endonuclease (ribonuclease M5)